MKKSSDEICKKSSKELGETLASLRRELVANVFESKSGSSSNNTARRGAIKKEIARILTVLSLRRIRGSDV